MNIFTKTKNTIMSSKVTKNGPGGVESIDDIGKAVVSGDIILLPDEYANFWSCIAKDRQSCARFMARIVVTLLNFEQDPVKSERSIASKGAVVSATHLINVLLNTIQFIDMFIGFDPKNEAFVSAMDKYELAKKATPSFRNKDIHEGLSGLAKRRGNRGLAAVKMIVECSSLESPEEILHAANMSFKSPERGTTANTRQKSEAIIATRTDDHEDISLEKEAVDFPFTFTGLSRMTKVDISPMIFDELLKQLEGAGSALSSMAHMQGRTLALMFMLREFLTISPTADHMWMQRACLVLVGLYKWPKPYGIVAKDLLDFIYLERRSPGCHLRERIIEENPILHPAVMLRSHNITYKPLHPKYPTQNDDSVQSYFATPSRTCPINFVYLDKSVPLCCTHKHLLLTSTNSQRSHSTQKSLSSTSSKASGTRSTASSPRTKSESEHSLTCELRIDIISNVFDTDFVIFPKVDGKSKNKVRDPLGLCSLPEEDIIILYCQVLEVLERAKTLPVNAGLGGEHTDMDLNGQPITIPGGLSKMYRESLLGSLLERLYPGKVFAPRRSSDEKVQHVIRQSRRTSLIQQENISDRRSSLIEDVSGDIQGDIVANARQESKRLAQVLAPDEMALLEGDSEDEETCETANEVFNTSENTIHDPVLFGQNAPGVPDIQIEVIDVKKKRRAIGEEIDAVPRYSNCPTKADYDYSTNHAGYLHINQDVDDLIAVIRKGESEWNKNFGVDVSISSDMSKVNIQDSEQGKRSGAGTSGVQEVKLNDDDKIKIKIILMGSDLVVHRFLTAYVALYTKKDFTLSNYKFEVFVVPEGKNNLGVFLARSDKWYRRHIFDSFKGSLGICPQYSTVREYSSFDCDELNMQNCLPVSNLRQLLHNYVRQATQKSPFSVYECLCWAAYPEESSKKNQSSDDSANDMNVFNQKCSHDIIIPFVMQVQLGLHAQLEQFREKPSSMSKLEKQNDKRLSLHSHHEKETLSMRECFADKDAMFNATELSVQYLPSSITAPVGNTNKAVHQNGPSPSTILVDSFATLSVTNFPCHNASRDDLSKKGTTTAMTMSSEELIMESQLCKGACADLFANRRKNAKSMDAFLESLHDKSTFEHPQHIGAVEINVTNPSDNFHILVDGALYGPFRRLIIRTCNPEGVDGQSKVDASASSDEGLTLPIMTYMPLH